MNSKRRLYKLTNLTVFAALLKDLLMGCGDAVLPIPLLKICTINCFIFDEHTRQPYNDILCLFCAPALHLRETQKFKEKTSKSFNLYTKRSDGKGAKKIQGVHLNDVPPTEEVLLLNKILLYDIRIVYGNIIGENARTVQKHKSTVQLLRYNNQVFYVRNSNANF